MKFYQHGIGLESDHGLEKIVGVGLELEFKSMEPDWIWTPKKVTPLVSGLKVDFLPKGNVKPSIPVVSKFFEQGAVCRYV